MNERKVSPSDLKRTIRALNKAINKQVRRNHRIADLRTQIDQLSTILGNVREGSFLREDRRPRFNEPGVDADRFD